MEYKDYYDILGVDRGASQKEITKAFRRLARKHHPDVSKASDAADRFKEINEAYEVLRDPKKRKLYDSLGNNWQAGQNFSPPPGFDGVRMEFGGSGGDGAAFSDFFDALFGGMGGFGGQRQSSHQRVFRNGGGRRGPEPFSSTNGDPFASFGGFGGGFSGGSHGRRGGPSRGDDHEVEVEVSLEELYHGVTKKITLQGPEGTRSYDVKIPAGIVDGGKIRLSGQGGGGRDGGDAGHLYLKVRLRPHASFKVDRYDLTVDVPVTPWDAALGGKVQVPTLDGPVSLTVPSGSCSGRRMRLKGKGLPNKKGARGDLYAVIRIVVPEKLSPRERELFEQLSQSSSFRPSP